MAAPSAVSPGWICPFGKAQPGHLYADALAGADVPMIGPGPLHVLTKCIHTESSFLMVKMPKLRCFGVYSGKSSRPVSFTWLRT